MWFDWFSFTPGQKYSSTRSFYLTGYYVDSLITTRLIWVYSHYPFIMWFIHRSEIQSWTDNKWKHFWAQCQLSAKLSLLIIWGHLAPHTQMLQVVFLGKCHRMRCSMISFILWSVSGVSAFPSKAQVSLKVHQIRSARALTGTSGLAMDAQPSYCSEGCDSRTFFCTTTGSCLRK